MPRRPGFRTDDLRRLAAELQFAPRDTLLRIADRAESLIDELEAASHYPADFVVFRLTGYRPGASGQMLQGMDLCADLPTLIVHLSDRARFCADDTQRQARSIPEIAADLGISVRSLQRYRSRGLVCHMLRDTPASMPRLVCFTDALLRFRKRSGRLLERAERFTRLDDETEAAMHETAARLAATGCSLHEAARRIAAEIGRAPETVRRNLLVFDQRTGLFRAHGRLTDRDAAVIDRARRIGIPLARLAARYGKTTATIRRAGLRVRAQWLREHRPPWRHLPTFDLVDAPRIILGAEPVVERLDHLLPRFDALLVVRACDETGPRSENEVAAMLAAVNLLQRDASRQIDLLPDWPSARDVDAIETMLRWAGQVRRRLVTLLLPVVVKRLRTGGGLALESLPGDALRSIIRRSVHLLVREIERADAMRATRFGSRIAFVADLHAAHESAQWRERAGRATVRHRDGGVPMRDLFEGVMPWGTRLDLPRSSEERLDRLDAAARELVEAYYGLSAAPAMSMRSLAERYRLTESRITRRLEEAVDRLRAGV